MLTTLLVVFCGVYQSRDVQINNTIIMSILIKYSVPFFHFDATRENGNRCRIQLEATSTRGNLFS